MWVTNVAGYGFDTRRSASQPQWLRGVVFLRLCLYLRSVLECDAHFVLAVNRHEIYEAVPEHGLKLGDDIQPPELVEKDFDRRLPSQFIAYCCRDRVQPSFSFVEPLGQPVVAFLVFSLVERDVGVFLNALLQEHGDHHQLTLQRNVRWLPR